MKKKPILDFSTVFISCLNGCGAVKRMSFRIEEAKKMRARNYFQ